MPHFKIHSFYVKPNESNALKKAELDESDALKSIGGSDIIEYSLSGSSKALAD